ncbi:hypothetical protein SDC9_166631 [bioreactor metagenome]|uniref:Uncharacterized protein n=1 Tax=bioreactor metagenome TaxID=1076179 RepID=A0A645G540_9ZZZZ
MQVGRNGGVDINVVSAHGSIVAHLELEDEDISFGYGNGEAAIFGVDRGVNEGCAFWRGFVITKLQGSGCATADHYPLRIVGCAQWEIRAIGFTYDVLTSR